MFARVARGRKLRYPVVLGQQQWTRIQKRHVDALGYKPRPNEMFRGIPMREWQVLLAAGLDLSAGETAELMFLAPSSVKGIRERLRQRMGSTINLAVVRCLYEGDVLTFEDLF
jgi:hypothetical protein